eukprot:TRINITY_DN21273_c0_g1_i6.p2 TRINITY_DN21273_c0_g1~~TRINITY_DN21273_c0_g1_i6.p2  ORF type:complete len:111 (+),score=15.39 TRINITY_DN21273_c0_g1_i6:23-334(+)
MAFLKISTLTVCLIGTIMAMAEPVRAEQLPEGFGKRGAGGYDYDYYNPNFMYYQKRGGSLCLPFGLSCSVKGIPCCGDTTACRCNLFGSNCKCQRAALFGRKR